MDYEMFVLCPIFTFISLPPLICPSSLLVSTDVEGVDAQRMLEENQRQMEEMEKSWQQRLDEAKREFEKKQEEMRRKEEDDADMLCK